MLRETVDKLSIILKQYKCLRNFKHWLYLNSKIIQLTLSCTSMSIRSSFLVSNFLKFSSY